MRIRPVQDADQGYVIKLWEICGLTRPWNDPQKDFAFARLTPSSEILVGEIESQIIASVLVGHDGHRGAIYYLSVEPEHQGKGYGRAIHQAAVDWLREQGVWKINLSVRSENQAVQKFYERLGYVQNHVINLGLRLAP